MKLDSECKACLYNSQLKKVERGQTDESKLNAFKDGIKMLCENPPPDYCAPFLMRDINAYHAKIFGCGIDYSREKSMFNRLLLNLEEELYLKITSSPDPIEEALKLAMASNYIDFARLSNLDGQSLSVVLSCAERAAVDKTAYEIFKQKLQSAKTLLYLHDNCGEIVLDKLLIRAVKKKYPQIEVTSVVRGQPIINDVTVDDAKEVGLDKFAEVIDNGSDVPGTYLREVSSNVVKLLKQSGVVLSKGLGNLETLYGEGFKIFYAFNCKCNHIAQRFGAPLWSAVFAYED